MKELVTLRDKHPLQTLQWVAVEDNGHMLDDTKVVVVRYQDRISGQPFLRAKCINPLFLEDNALSAVVAEVKKTFPEITHVELEPHYTPQTYDISGQLKTMPYKSETVRNTTILDLTLPEEDLFNGFSRTHKLNIKKARKNDYEVDIFRSGEQEAIDRFIDVIRGMQTTKVFFGFAEERYRKVWQSFSASSDVFIALCRKDGEDLGAHMVVCGQNSAYDIYSGKTSKGRSERISQLLSFECIKESKHRGLELYDFWGISSFNDNGDLDKDELYGISQYKLAFGGEKYTHGKAYVLIIKPVQYRVHRISVFMAKFKSKLIKFWRNTGIG